MITFLKTAAVIACMVAIIPLAVWAGSGSWRHAVHATKGYLIAMGVLVVPAAVLALVMALPW